MNDLIWSSNFRTDDLQFNMLCSHRMITLSRMSCSLHLLYIKQNSELKSIIFNI